MNHSQVSGRHAAINAACLIAGVLASCLVTGAAVILVIMAGTVQ